MKLKVYFCYIVESFMGMDKTSWTDNTPNSSVSIQNCNIRIFNFFTSYIFKFFHFLHGSDSGSNLYLV